MAIDPKTTKMLKCYAARYEAPEFIIGDPSFFMHQVNGNANREATAFVASCLSFGSRESFMRKIGQIVRLAGGNVDLWIREGRFAVDFPRGSTKCFYRFFTEGNMHDFFEDYRRLLDESGTLGEYVGRESNGDGLAAVKSICRRFGMRRDAPVVPKDASSACKRVCMFLRWMVRDSSPVDLGLWAKAIDRRTLIMPLDTHVVHQSMRLGLLTAATSSMSAARRLTALLAEVFPDDPLRGDFALFGYGVNHTHA